MNKTFILSLLLTCGAIPLCAQTTQSFTHMTIKSGFNQDVICEDSSHVAATMSQFSQPDLQGIDGSGFGFYTSDVQDEGAMCDASGEFKSSRTGATFKVNPTGLNALVLKGTKTTTVEGKQIIIPNSVTEGTLVFETPVSAKSVYVVGTSADGNTSIEVTINYSDGTNVKDNITMYNWDNKDATSSAAAVVTGLGRIASKKNWEGAAGHISKSYNFNLFESSVNTDNTKTINSVTIKQTNSGSSAAIFAVSTSDEKVSSGVSGMTVAGKKVSKYYSLTGQELPALQKGVVIVKYNDGTTRKVVVR